MSAIDWQVLSAALNEGRVKPKFVYADFVDMKFIVQLSENGSDGYTVGGVQFVVPLDSPSSET